VLPTRAPAVAGIDRQCQVTEGAIVPALSSLKLIQPRVEIGRLLDLFPFGPVRVPKKQTAVAFPPVCTHALFERQVMRTPYAMAVRHAGQVLTYRELNRRANQIARHLRARGAGPGTLVGVCAERTPDLVAALLGVWKAGAAYVPLDPAYPAERLAFVLADSGAHLVVGDEASLARVPVTREDVLVIERAREALQAEDAENLPHLTTPVHLAYVMYTSGSTGTPKGAMITHRGLVNYLWWAISAYGVEAGGAVPVHSSIAFDLTVTSLYPALLAGASIELVPEERGGEHLLKVLRSKGHSLVKITPAHLELLSRQLDPAEAAGMTRAFVIGGENLSAETLSFWRKAAPETRLINEYGPTETVVGCSIYEVAASDPHFGPVPIGRPIANTELYVADEQQKLVPAGVTGELFIGGAGVARGYWNRPELTTERFVPDRFSGRPGQRLYRTGDLARYRKDGVIEFLGRTDHQVKIRGYRIELGEVEAALSAHPAVHTCAVLAREDSPGDKQLVAYVVQRDAEPLAPEAYRQFLRVQLPEYMVPAHVICLDTLPLTHNGKIDRRALPSPADLAVHADDPGGARTPSEALVLRVFRDVLARPDLTIADNFFDAGGHSLSAARLMSTLREASGFDLPLRSLFDRPTASGLAALLESLAFAGKNAAPVASTAWEHIEL
jgi:amino acid adenylation domain-containing protein